MRLIRTVLFAAVCGMVPGLASASVTLDCSTTNICLVFISSPGSPTPFNIYWGWNYASGAPHTQVVIPQNCEDDWSCTFRCPQQDSALDVSVTVTDASNNPVGSDTAYMNCSRDDG